MPKSDMKLPKGKLNLRKVTESERPETATNVKVSPVRGLFGSYNCVTELLLFSFIEFFIIGCVFLVARPYVLTTFVLRLAGRDSPTQSASAFPALAEGCSPCSSAMSRALSALALCAVLRSISSFASIASSPSAPSSPLELLPRICEVLDDEAGTAGSRGC